MHACARTHLGLRPGLRDSDGPLLAPDGTFKRVLRLQRCGRLASDELELLIRDWSRDYMLEAVQNGVSCCSHGRHSWVSIGSWAQTRFYTPRRHILMLLVDKVGAGCQ